MLKDVYDYYSHDDWALMKAEMDRRETPFLVVNLKIIRRNYGRSAICTPSRISTTP